MVAITLVAGAAVFGWVNGQAGSSESAYGQSAAQGINYLREHFAPVTYSFSGCTGSVPNRACTVATFYVYNNGQLAFTLYSLQIQSAVGNPNPLSILYTSTSFTSSSCTPNTQASPALTGPASPVPIGTISNPNYSVTIPACTISGGLVGVVVGQSYVITMAGLYSNVVQFQLTASG
jgi:hypothetical protein